jgi:hypothetical protein
MTREENIKFLQTSISYFIDLFIYNIQDVEIVRNITENKERIVNELTDSFLSNELLSNQLKRELDNIEFDLQEVWREEDEKI